MILFKKSTDIISHLAKQKEARLSVGFVPTMGALHPGHISLIDESKRKCDLTVSSIFVNPTQFNNPNDLEKYPVTLEKDIYMLGKNGCDVLFHPDVNEIYPEGKIEKKHFDLGFLETVLEGKYRPGHFQGVCQVVEILLETIKPNSLFMGQKDYQQCMVVKKLLELMNLNIQLVICPTLREPDGLAMSSRNLLLNNDERNKAPEIYKTLSFIKENIQQGSLIEIKKRAKEYLESKGFKVDYIEIADAANLKIADEWNSKQTLIALGAVFINEVRLIDNLLL